MNSNIIKKYIKLILSVDSTEILSYANLQYHYLNSDIEFCEYFSLLADSNIFYASLIYFYFKKQHKFENTKAIDIITTKIREQHNQLQGERIDLRPTSRTTFRELSSKLLEIEKIADLCIADLIIYNDESLHNEIFLKTVKRIRSREDSYGLFLSRCSELLALMDNHNRCFYTINLIDEMKKQYPDEDNRVLYLVLKILANRPLHFYGDISPKMIDFIFEIYSLNDPHAFQQLLLLFPQIDFSLLATDLLNFLKMADKYICCEKRDHALIKFLQCAELLYSRDNKDTSDIEFKNAVLSEFQRYFDNNAALEKTIFLFFACNDIKNHPQNIDEYLERLNISDDIYKYSLLYIEQAAFNALVRDNPTKVSTFLKELGNSNAYRINYSVRNPGINYSIHRPEIDKNIDLFKSQIEKLSSCCDIDELVYIFFNSNIRSLLPIEHLLHIVYDKSPKKRDDYMIVSNTFSKYIVEGKIVYDNRQKPHFSTEQFCTKSPYLTVIGHDQLSSEAIKKLKNDRNGIIHMSIESFSVTADFNPHMRIITSANIVPIAKTKKETIEYFENYLASIAQKGSYTKEDISTLKDMPDKLERNSDCARLGMGLLRCCYSFNDNITAIKFLRSIYNNPYRARNYYDPSIQVGLRIDDKDYQFCLEYVKHIIDGNGYPEDKLFIYFNTILGNVYYLNSFLIRLSGLKDPVDLCMLYDTYGLHFHGRIKTVTQKEIVISPYGYRLIRDWRILSIKPTGKNIFREKDEVSYSLNSAYCEKKVLLVEGLKKRTFRNTYFCNGMNKAKLTLDLDEHDIRNLLRSPAGLKLSELIELALNELLAIKLRLFDFETLYFFLNLIKDSNPWSFSADLIPCIVIKNKSNKYQIESTINDLIDNCSIDYATYVYFNSSLKSTISTDDFVSKLLSKHKDTDKIISSLSEYSVHILKTENKLGVGSNVYLNTLQFSRYIPGKYTISGYDKENHLLKLKPLSNQQ